MSQDKLISIKEILSDFKDDLNSDFGKFNLENNKHNEKMKLVIDILSQSIYGDTTFDAKIANEHLSDFKDDLNSDFGAYDVPSKIKRKHNKRLNAIINTLFKIRYSGAMVVQEKQSMAIYDPSMGLEELKLESYDEYECDDNIKKAYIEKMKDLTLNPLGVRARGLMASGFDRMINDDEVRGYQITNYASEHNKVLDDRSERYLKRSQKH